ncbi:MAG TPA: DUF3160 domain-containing protein [Phycisphaerae bacterium]|nr:DUF3160 domain-containing protein [Phycisphaerae bacterium]
MNRVHVAVCVSLISLTAAGEGLAQWQLRQRRAGRDDQAPQQASERVKVRVPKDVEPMLAELGFAVVPTDYASGPLARMYRLWRHQHLPVVVTSDAALHTWHLLCDWYQRFLEIAHLRGDLINLTDALCTKMMGFHDQAERRQVKEAALANVAYLIVGKRLLEGGSVEEAPEPWKSKIEGELRLIREADGLAVSPLFGYREDYSQYTPRGHYSRSEEFKSYFRAMMWYGRMAFRLKSEDPQEAIRQTRMALLMCQALQNSKVKGEDALAVWRRIYETTAFFAGRSDDLLPTDYLALLGQRPKGYDAADDEHVAQLIAAASRLSKPRILSTWMLAEAAGGPKWRESTAGMRLLGTRYALDSEVMQRLVFESVGAYRGGGDGPKPFTCVRAGPLWIRGFPRGLDVMAALGFEKAQELLRDDGDDRYERYAAQLAKLKDEIAAAPEEQWRSDLYVMRLRAAALLADAPQGTLPTAMSRPEWSLKQLTTALGSWTELRHDTILYTKQSYSASQAALAGMTKGGPAPPPPPSPRGYVEPVPAVYQAIREGVEVLRGKITTLAYPEDKALVEHLSRFALDVSMLEDISKKELSGDTLTEEEYRFIENIGDSFRVPTLGYRHHRDVSKPFMTETDDEMPIVADVHTDVNTRQVLEEAVGWPWELLMVCPVDGEPVVCKGVVYSYYEFKQPMSQRLTDERWRKMLEEGKAPPPPAWAGRYSVERK